MNTNIIEVSVFDVFSIIGYKIKSKIDTKEFMNTINKSKYSHEIEITKFSYKHGYTFRYIPDSFTSLVYHNGKFVQCFPISILVDGNAANV